MEHEIVVSPSDNKLLSDDIEEKISLVIEFLELLHILQKTKKSYDAYQALASTEQAIFEGLKKVFYDVEVLKLVAAERQARANTRPSLE